jgi:hypothetical protein
MISRSIPLRAATAPIPTIHEENLVIVVLDDLDAGFHHDERRRSIEGDGR